MTVNELIADLNKIPEEDRDDDLYVAEGRFFRRVSSISVSSVRVTPVVGLEDGHHRLPGRRLVVRIK